MIDYHDIRDVHLEISTLCNAACPWCPRTFWGYPYNGGYPELNLSLNSAKKIFQPEFLKQLKSIRINGNYGDIVMNPDTPDIVDYFLEQNPLLKITISTNGSAQSKEFWQRLAMPGVTVFFALDGLEDTHRLYRQNTIWHRIIENAQTFIDAGGLAVWKMIEFKHNQHQVDACKAMSQKMGFFDFALIKSTRTSAPVFDRNGELVHVMGDYTGETDFEILFHKKTNDEVLLDDVLPGKTPCKKIDCETIKLKSIYIAANGDVSPCCYTGFYPKTYGHGQYHQAANAQLVPLILKNNALEYPLEECIQWFRSIEKSWEIQDYHQGRLLVCDDNCGQN